MAEDSLARVNYYDRQFLRTQDFSDEQAYHLAIHRRHQIGGHIWGIVYGLEVVVDANGSPGILPGMAVDGYGRDLVLPYPYTIDPRAFDDQGSERLEVWLQYGRLESDPPASGYAACEGGQQYNRAQELASVLLRPPDAALVMDVNLDLPERRQPAEVPAADLRFDATRVPPDDPARRWPVYLGLLRRQRDADPQFVASLEGRPYAGLVGEWIRSASGQVTVQVGSSEQADDPYRFAVYLDETLRVKKGGLRGRTAPTSPPLFPTPGAEPRLAVTAGGEIELRGSTWVDGDLTVEGGALKFGVGLASSRSHPWQMYHVRGPEDPDDPASPVVEQLRIEMASAAAPLGENQVVIGKWSAKENKFKPCLTVDDTCTVTVHGNLLVEGLLEENVPAGGVAQPVLSVEAQANYTGMVMMSLFNKLAELSKPDSEETGGELPVFGLGAPVGTTVLPMTAARGGGAPSLGESLQQISALLRDNALLMAPFLDALLDDPATRAQVSELLKGYAAGPGGAGEPAAARQAAPEAAREGKAEAGPDADQAGPPAMPEGTPPGAPAETPPEAPLAEAPTEAPLAEAPTEARQAKPPRARGAARRTAPRASEAVPPEARQAEPPAEPEESSEAAPEAGEPEAPPEARQAEPPAEPPAEKPARRSSSAGRSRRRGTSGGRG